MIIVSILNILILGIGFLIGLKKKTLFIFSLYISFTFTVEMLSIFEINSMPLFSLSYYAHAACLTYYFLVYQLTVKKTNAIVYLAILALPMIYVLLKNYSAANYEPIDRWFYNLWVVFLILIMLVKYYDQQLNSSKYLISFLLISLTYFSLDFIIALTSNYLINELTSIVAWVWLFRVLCLCLFYIFLVCFSIHLKPISKT
jgi:hypothetical protein